MNVFHWCGHLVFVTTLWSSFLKETNGNAKLTFEFVDKDKDILKLTCHGDCSTDKQTVSTISIFNSTSQKVYGVARSAKSPNLIESAFGEISFYVAGGVNPTDKTCYLDLLLVKCGSFRHLELGCNITTVDEEAEVHVEQALLIIERQVSEASPQLDTSLITLCVAVVMSVVSLILTLALVYVKCKSGSGSRSSENLEVHLYEEPDLYNTERQADVYYHEKQEDAYNTESQKDNENADTETFVKTATTRHLSTDYIEPVTPPGLRAQRKFVK